MVDAAKSDGVEWVITDSYRDLETQKDMVKRKGLYSKGGLAAEPGKSNHGWGSAVDLNFKVGKGNALEWLKKNGPMGLVGSWVINPDLPMTRLQQQAEAFASPSKLIGQMYPTYKLPVEMFARRQMSNGVPFTDKYDEAKGLDRLIAEISNKVLGDQGLPFSQGPLARVNADGKTELDPFVSYGIGNAIPLIAKIQRLTGGLLGGKPTYQERTATSWLSEFGVPVRNVGEREQRGATIGKQFDIANLMKELARRGLVEKDN